MSELTTIARPYAKAAFDFAVEKKALDNWAEMLAFMAEVTVNPTVAELLSGQFNADQLAEMFVNIGGDQLDKHGQNLIKVMAENGRLMVLPAVAAEFVNLVNEHKKEVLVDVESAKKLTAKQLDKIAASLEKRLARKVKLNCGVNPDLIAGVIITAEDLVIDGSVRGKLSRLSDTLQS